LYSEWNDRKIFNEDGNEEEEEEEEESHLL
jgi:hypothetical protein